MSLSFDKPILCPILVGRESYLNVLKQQLDEAGKCQGRTFLLAGEAGIGKSRLVAEAKAWANQAGLLTLQGNCFASDRVLPFALELVKFIKFMPELGMLLSDVIPSLVLKTAQEKRRYFQTFDEFINRKNIPSLVIIEDIHWCDDTSLEFFPVLRASNS